jgi:tRNA A-37 threonylcarbamoyl transferase component Bud32/Flp pilus assembly protein TadD
MADPLLGRTVAHYEIVARLGGGGMGVVYKARDRKLDRDVALKFLPQQWSHDEGAKQRFVREAQAASATHHPNICTIHDIGAADDGQLFIVMGYYDGPTLKQRLESGPLSVDEALEIATQVADGLAKAHAQGIVHRDVKPGNLILTDDGVRIVDFGLATFVDALQLTAQGSTIGTAAYMSPEQVRGDEADAHSDVWALGVVLYEMLTGHVPFRGSYAEAIFHAIRHDTPRPIRDERSEVPEDVEQLVFRALHKDPAVRFDSGRDFARALRQVRGLTVPQDLRTVPIDARDAQMAHGVVPRRRRRRRVAAAVAAVAAVLTVASAWLLYPVERVHIAVAPVSNQTSYLVLHPYRMALTEEMSSRLADSPVVRVVPYERLLQIVRRFRDSRDADVAEPGVLQALAEHSGARMIVVPILLREGDAWKARAEIRDPANGETVATVETDAVTSALPKEAAFDLVIQLTQRVKDHFLGEGPVRASLSASARRLVSGDEAAGVPRLGTLDAAEAFERGLDAYERMEYAIARDAFGEAAGRAPRNPLPQAWRSRVAALMRQDRDADESADRAAALSADALPASDRLFVEASVADRRDQRAAEERYRELAARYPDEPAWLIERAAFEDRQGRVREAEASYASALKLDAALPRPHLELCRLYSPSRLNDPAAAREQGEAAFKAYRALGNRGGEAQARWCLSDVLRAGSDAERREARGHADAALEIMQGLGYPYGISRAYNYVGVVALLAQRNGREAASFFEKSLTGTRQVGNRFLEPRLLMNLGVSYELFGERAKAVSYYRESFTLFEELGNQQEAAWNQVNAAAILIDYGGDVELGVRDAQNARSVLENLGDKYFEVFARRMVASYYRHVGQGEEATRELTIALGIAQELDLKDRIAQVLIDWARLRFDGAEYAAAERFLLDALQNASGTDRVHARIELARVQTRLGRFTDAEAGLATALSEIDAAKDDGSRPLWYAARGELAYESGRRDEAKAWFDRAAAFWTDDLPEAPSVEARAYSGMLEALQRGGGAGRAAVVASLEQARRMRRLALAARCLLLLARIDLAAGRVDEALRSLDAISPDAQRAAGPEFRVLAEYWRSRAIAPGDAGAASAAASSLQRAVDDLRTRIPGPDRAGWMARPDIALAVGSAPAR